VSSLSTTFINPLRLLRIDPGKPFDETSVRRANRRLLLDFELGDGRVVHDGLSVTLSDMRPWLESVERDDGYCALQLLESTPGLSRFLSTGDPTDLPPSTEISSRAHTTLTRHFGQLYSSTISSGLRAALRSMDPSSIQLFFRAPMLWDAVGQRQIDQVVDAFIGHVRSDVEAQSAKLERGEDIPFATDQIVSRKVVAALLALPRRYDTARGGVTREITNLAINVFNELDDEMTASELLQVALSIPSPEPIRAHCQKQLVVIERTRRERVIADEYQQDIAAWSHLLTFIEERGEAIASSTAASAISVAKEVVSRVSITEVNALPAQLVSLRVALARSMRALSVSIWNTHSDSISALMVLNHAKNMRAGDEMQALLATDYVSLLKMHVGATESALKLALVVKGFLDEKQAAYTPNLSAQEGRDWVINKVMLVLNDEDTRDAMRYLTDSQPALRAEIIQRVVQVLLNVEDSVGAMPSNLQEGVNVWMMDVPGFSPLLVAARDTRRRSRRRVQLLFLAIVAIVVTWHMFG